MKTLVLTAMMVVFGATMALAGSLDFYEGPSGTQTKHCTLDDKAGQNYNLKKKGHPCPNDDLKSVVINGVRVGAVLRVYDDPGGNPNKDDWTEIVVKKVVQQYTVPDFERTYEDDVVRVTYHRDNGLNGKVSHISIN